MLVIQHWEMEDQNFKIILNCRVIPRPTWANVRSCLKRMIFNSRLVDFLDVEPVYWHVHHLALKASFIKWE